MDTGDPIPNLSPEVPTRVPHGADDGIEHGFAEYQTMFDSQMFGGGTLWFETRNLEVGRSEVQNGPVPRPGSYVLLTVCDSGTGMDAETQEHPPRQFFELRVWLVFF